ncbi:hypothetical protein CYY_000134 [Polysphondylium violaceum]|uniref:phosphatidylinositol 3-kinase n=1 Tax=Polysphondylium violaceum TaxID=133409 RepID=A0A8J4VBT0_9MYCE|nr:hypothetical protein CYY_000134 [Polysphondylium violaceum]
MSDLSDQNTAISTTTTTITTTTLCEEYKLNSSTNSNNSSDNNNDLHVSIGAIQIAEENKRVENENKEITELYKQKNMEFHRKEVTRLREGSILNLEKKGLVSLISQRFQTPDTASYTKPNGVAAISIKERIISQKKEFEKKKVDEEIQQREKVINLTENGVLEESVLIERMNKIRKTVTPESQDIDEKEEQKNNKTNSHAKSAENTGKDSSSASTSTNEQKSHIKKTGDSTSTPSASIPPLNISPISLKQIQQQPPQVISSPKSIPTTSATPTGPTSKKPKKSDDKKVKANKKVASPSVSVSASPSSPALGGVSSPSGTVRRRRGGKELVALSKDFEKNIQIYMTIPNLTQVIKNPQPPQPITPVTQNFINELIASNSPAPLLSAQDSSLSLHKINNTLSNASGGSKLVSSSDSQLLTSTSLRVKALKAPFEILFILPNQSKKKLMCKGSDTIEQIKERLTTEYLSVFISKSTSPVKYGADSFVLLDYHNTPLERTLTLNKCEYVIDKRSNGLLPKLKMVEKSQFLDADPVNELTAIENETIKKLVPNINNWKGEEVDYFRKLTSRLRYEALPDIKGSIQSTLLVRLSPLPVPVISSRILVSVFLAITQVTKTLIIEPGETADDLLVRIYTKNYAKHLPNVKPSDFVLKVIGSADYIHGPHDMRTFETIRTHIIQGTKPLLTMIQRPKAELDPPPFTPRFDYPPEIAIDYDVNEYSSKSNEFDVLTHISIRDIKKPLKVKVMGACAIPTSYLKDEDSISVIVSMAIFHGIECLSKGSTSLISTAPISLVSPSGLETLPTFSIDWNETITFTNLDYANIPMDARLCISLYATTNTSGTTSNTTLVSSDGVNDISSGTNNNNSTEIDTTSLSKKDFAIGWVNLMLSDFKSELRSGIQQLTLWPDDIANPLGTCSNNPSSQAVTLLLQFEEFAQPVIFPSKNTKIPIVEPPTINSNDMREFFEGIIKLDPLSDLSKEKYSQLWALRHYSMLFPQVLPRLMLSVPWTQANAVDEAHSLISKWPKLKPYDALELLDAKHADRILREYAVSCLDELTDEELLDILLQLVQVLKYEPYHDTKLSRFLLKKAILSRSIGHAFFWYLKSDLHVDSISERFGILLESYLIASGMHRGELLKQLVVIDYLTDIAKKIKPLKDQDRREFMMKEMELIDWPKRFHLTLNPRFESNGLIISKCRYMDSKKLPLRLSFTNTDMGAESIEVIFKVGDDLRQDMLTLQMIKLMDKLWQKEGLDFKMSPYGCISTGDMIGMIEVVLNAETTAKIQKGAGGATAAFKLDPLANWLLAHNKTEPEYNKAVDTFILSCAGYCVATYVLGIGDRHNDNLMCTKLGRLFHIDFGHFLGNYKKKFGFKRERAPFVFTPDFCYVMGGKDSAKFSQFVNYCCDAYNILRKNAKLFMNLFAMMVSTGIPELQSMQDLNYLKESFSLELSEEKAREKFIGLIHESLSTKTTQFNNAIHILAH